MSWTDGVAKVLEEKGIEVDYQTENRIDITNNITREQLDDLFDLFDWFRGSHNLRIEMVSGLENLFRITNRDDR